MELELTEVVASPVILETYSEVVSSLPTPSTKKVSQSEIIDALRSIRFNQVDILGSQHITELLVLKQLQTISQAVQYLLAHVITRILKLQEWCNGRMIWHILAKEIEVCLHTIRAALLKGYLSGGDIMINVAESLLLPCPVGNIRFAY